MRFHGMRKWTRRWTRRLAIILFRATAASVMLLLYLAASAEDPQESPGEVDEARLYERALEIREHFRVDAPAGPPEICRPDWVSVGALAFRHGGPYTEFEWDDCCVKLVTTTGALRQWLDCEAYRDGCKIAGRGRVEPLSKAGEVVELACRKVDEVMSVPWGQMRLVKPATYDPRYESWTIQWMREVEGILSVEESICVEVQDRSGLVVTIDYGVQDEPLDTTVLLTVEEARVIALQCATDFVNVARGMMMVRGLDGSLPPVAPVEDVRLKLAIVHASFTFTPDGTRGRSLKEVEGLGLEEGLRRRVIYWCEILLRGGDKYSMWLDAKTGENVGGAPHRAPEPLFGD